VRKRRKAIGIERCALMMDEIKGENLLIWSYEGAQN
jgi:hypothetical protein